MEVAVGITSRGEEEQCSRRWEKRRRGCRGEVETERKGKEKESLCKGFQFLIHLDSGQVKSRDHNPNCLGFFLSISLLFPPFPVVQSWPLPSWQSPCETRHTMNFVWQYAHFPPPISVMAAIRHHWLLSPTLSLSLSHVEKMVETQFR